MFYFLIPAKGQVAAPCMFHDTIYLLVHFLQVSFPRVQKIQPVHPKWDQSWVFIGRTDIEADTPIHWPPDAKNWLIWKDPDAQSRAGGEGDDRGWDGWMASPTQWTWVWVDSRSWWWTGRPGVPWLSDWTELNWHLFWVNISGVFFLQNFIASHIIIFK